MSSGSEENAVAFHSSSVNALNWLCPTENVVPGNELWRPMKASVSVQTASRLASSAASEKLMPWCSFHEANGVVGVVGSACATTVRQKSVAIIAAFMIVEERREG